MKLTKNDKRWLCALAAHFPGGFLISCFSPSIPTDGGEVRMTRARLGALLEAGYVVRESGSVYHITDVGRHDAGAPLRTEPFPEPSPEPPPPAAPDASVEATAKTALDTLETMRQARWRLDARRRDVAKGLRDLGEEHEQLDKEIESLDETIRQFSVREDSTDEE